MHIRKTPLSLNQGKWATPDATKLPTALLLPTIYYAHSQLSATTITNHKRLSRPRAPVRSPQRPVAALTKEHATKRQISATTNQIAIYMT